MNILIFRDDGIGDLIVTTSLIEKILLLNNKSKITLIVSDRNVDYAEILLDNGKIHKIVNIDKYKSSISKIYNLYKILKNILFDHTLILKSSNYSIILSKILNSGVVSGIIPLNSKPSGKNRYKPMKMLINFFFSFTEIIDCRKNYSNSMNIHMRVHYDSLLNNISAKKFKKIPLQNYSRPKLSIDRSIEILDSLLLSFKNNNFLIFHFDEKWNLSNYSNKEIFNLIISISNIYKGPVIITCGIDSNKYDLFISRILDLNNSFIKDVNIDVSQSKKKKNIYFFKKINIKSLIYLTSLCELIIEPHGALTHISSIYNKKVIDLILNDKKNFLLKWHPISDKMIQIDLNNKELILEKIKNFKN